MPMELNHTVVPARDPQASARFLAGILGLGVDSPVALRVTPLRVHDQRAGKSAEGRRGTYFRDPDGHFVEILTPGGAGL